jgi:hypothetical protein
MKYPASHLTPFPPAFSRQIVRKKNRTGERSHRSPPDSAIPFRINTCKSVSKQRALSTSRMNTYAKTGGGGLIALRLSSGFVYLEIPPSASSISMSSAFMQLQIPPRANSFFSHSYKTPGVGVFSATLTQQNLMVTWEVPYNRSLNWGVSANRAAGCDLRKQIPWR